MSIRSHIHFVTGKLAEPALREVVGKLSRECDFDFSIDRLPITVAALMTPDWLMRHLRIPTQATLLLLPGHLKDRLGELQSRLEIPVECGPRDLRDLPLHFGKKVSNEGYGSYSIEILAEINHANRMNREDIRRLAKRWKDQGANYIDLGCEPGQRWLEVESVVKELTELEIRVSIDTFDPWEAATAAKAGASLVLSVNRSNREAACDWGIEVVVVPDDFANCLTDLQETVDFLENRGVPFRVDPILEPIGCGFANSLQRYHATRAHFPDAPMMMGIGNLTELSDVDSAGINLLLLGYCQELQIGSVLTTEVIPWAQSSVRECDYGRKLVHFAVTKKIPPKRIDESLVLLRDARKREYSAAFIDELATSIKDNNYRILVSNSQIHLIAADVHLVGTDPFEMMNRLMELPQSRNVDPGHAFYLGYELSKAATAITLGKNYEQDEALNWGFLTRPEDRHRIEKKRR